MIPFFSLDLWIYSTICWVWVGKEEMMLLFMYHILLLQLWCVCVCVCVCVLHCCMLLCWRAMPHAIWNQIMRGISTRAGA